MILAVNYSNLYKKIYDVRLLFDKDKVNILNNSKIYDIDESVFVNFYVNFNLRFFKNLNEEFLNAKYGSFIKENSINLYTNVQRGFSVVTLNGPNEEKVNYLSTEIKKAVQAEAIELIKNIVLSKSESENKMMNLKLAEYYEKIKRYKYINPNNVDPESIVSIIYALEKIIEKEKINKNNILEKNNIHSSQIKITSNKINNLVKECKSNFLQNINMYISYLEINKNAYNFNEVCRTFIPGYYGADVNNATYRKISKNVTLLKEKILILDQEIENEKNLISQNIKKYTAQDDLIQEIIAWNVSLKNKKIRKLEIEMLNGGLKEIEKYMIKRDNIIHSLTDTIETSNIKLEKWKLILIFLILNIFVTFFIVFKLPIFLKNFLKEEFKDNL